MSIDDEARRRLPRYCAVCGEIFSDPEQACPNCGEPWPPPPLRPTVRILTALLTDMRTIWESGELGQAGYTVVRGHYEDVLLQLRPRRAERVAATPAPIAVEPRRTVPAPIAPPPVKRVTEPFLPKVEAWTSARQADILLYLGAFMLSLAALIFVGFQGNSGVARFAVLAGYTACFLTLGKQLPRWERVREASVVFLALGALLVPVNFIALRTQVLGGSVPVSWIWFAGATFSAAFYLGLGLSGSGRLYVYPGAAAVFVAWGALAAVLGLPPAWFGAWFALVAVLLHRLASRLPEPQRSRATLGSEILGAMALVAAQIVAAAGGRDRAQLPVTYLLIAADLAATLLARRARTRTLAVLPALVALTALTAWWSAFGLSLAWYGCFVAAAALGYLATASLDAPARAETWRWSAAAAGVGSLIITHAALASTLATHRTALPLTYAELLAGACFAYVRLRQRAALAVIPLAAAALGITAVWALHGAWIASIGAWGALAAAGYLAAAELDRSKRIVWQAGAAGVALLALAGAQSAVFVPGVATAGLPLTYGLVLAGALWSAWRARGAVRQVALAVVPPLAALLGVTTCWTLQGTPALQWLGAWTAAVALGYLAAAELDRPKRILWQGGAGGVALLALAGAHLAALLPSVPVAQLPSTYGLVLAGALWSAWRTRGAVRRAALAVVPPLAALVGVTTCWTVQGMPALQWLGAWTAGVALGYLALAELDRGGSARWRAYAAGAGGVAVVAAQTAAAVPGVASAALPLTYGMLLASAFWSVRQKRSVVGLAALPPLVALLGLTSTWALRGSPAVYWLGAWAAGTVIGYLAVGELDQPRMRLWREYAAGAGVLALSTALSFAASAGASSWQLPLTCAIGFAGVVWDCARRQDEAAALIPALGALLADSVLWAAGVGRAWWPFAGLTAAGVILVAAPWWRSRARLAKVGYCYLLALACGAPFVFSDAYRSQPGCGAAAYALAAALVFATALRARGALASLVYPDLRRAGAAAAARRVERQGLALLGFTLVGVAAGYVNAWAGLRDADQATVFALIGAVVWLGLAGAGSAWPELCFSLAPAGTVAMAIAAGLAAPDDVGRATLLLVAGTAGPAVAFRGGRRWSLWLVAAAFGAVAMREFWVWRGLASAGLPVAYAAVAAVLWAGLTRLRSYGEDQRGKVVSLLSWAPAVLAVATAALLLAGRARDLASNQGAAVVQTGAWAALTVAVVVAAALVVGEGVRMRHGEVWRLGTAGLLGAGLLAIAITHPGSVQAYTVPVGLYLLAFGFTFRRSAALFGHHMSLHEAIMVTGMLVLTLPPVRLGLQPGGSWYGLEVMGIGVLLVLTGLVLSARWVVAGGVLTLSGVAVRWVFVYATAAPGWLVLGSAGTALLGAGLLLLLQRERWERLRHRVGRWWLSVPVQP